MCATIAACASQANGSKGHFLYSYGLTLNTNSSICCITNILAVANIFSRKFLFVVSIGWPAFFGLMMTTGFDLKTEVHDVFITRKDGCHIFSLETNHPLL